MRGELADSLGPDQAALKEQSQSSRKFSKLYRTFGLVN